MKTCARIILVYISLITATGVAAQPCMLETGALYGTIEGNESAYALADSPDGTGFYVGGVKEDSTLIVKFDYQGLVIWSRTFDVIAGDEESLRCLIVDSDGNLVFGGISGSPTDGGTIYLGKFDPDADNIIWAKELVTGWTRNYLFGVREKGPGGNYVLTSNPHNDPGSVNNMEMLEITRSNGNLIPGATTMFTHGNSQQMSKIILHGGSVFGVGRYTEGASFAGMRNTITRLNATTYDAVWTRMGHVAANGTARLYGQDLFVVNDEIYSSYHGDPAGTSLTSTKVYVQKTDLDGNLIWLKQYDFPGNNENSLEMIESDGGIVMLAMKRSAPQEIMMMKMDYSGNVLWAKTYAFEVVSNVGLYLYGQQLLIEAGGYLIFSALGSLPSNGSEMVIVRTDLEGNVITPCVSALPIAVPVSNVSNPIFYAITPGTPSAPMTEDEPFPETVVTAILPTEYCGMADTIYAFVSATICEGEMYESYTIPGTYIDYFTTQDGCDSIRTLELNNYPPSEYDEQITICLGESYAGYTTTGVYTETHTNVFGCDSIYTLDLTVIALENEVAVTICSGQEYQGYSESGFYMDIIQGPPLECDTLQLLTLTVTAAPETTVLATICDGESYEGYSMSGTYVDDFVTGDGCDSVRTLELNVTDLIETSVDAMICEGESFEGYSSSGTYVDNFLSSQGCDSIRTLELTVTDPIETSVDAMICEGESFEGYSSSGTFVDDFVSQQGCDSIRTLILTVTDVITTSIDVTICEGDSFETHTQAGTYTDNFISVFGCDSIRTLTLSVNPPFQTAVAVTVCDGESYEGYSLAGIYVDAFTNTLGCDSIRTLTLMVNDTIRTAFTVELCEGETYEGYSAPGVFTDTYIAAAGCDSIRTVTLIEHVPTQTLGVQLCAGLEYDGYTETGSYVDTLQGANGACDTVRYLDLMIDMPLVSFINAAICEGDAFMGYTDTGLYIDTLVSIDGCDSIRTIQLTIQNILSATEQVTICNGESYQGYSIAGTYIDTFVTSLGCDSIRLLELIVDMPQIALEATICDGSSYLGYTASGVFTDVLPGNQGECDTIRTLTLVVTDVLMSFINASVCAGEQLEGYSTSGAYVDTFISIAGCDSVRTLILTVDEIVLTSLDHSICLGEMYEGYDTEGVFIDTFQATTGCDSVRTLNLTVGIIEKEIDATICNGQTYESYTLPGVYVDTIPAIAGLCDTLRTLNLSVTNTARTMIDQIICDGDTYAGYSQTGIYIDTLASPTGCDSIRELNLVKLDAIRSEVLSSSCDPDDLFNLPTGIHIDTLISTRGCDSVRTIVVEGASLYIPNVFTPNDDGVNDAFTITAFPALDLDLDYFAIFDRYGDMVYETDSWPVTWNGDDASEDPFQSGVFAYVMVYYCGDQKQVDHGNVTLVK